MVIHGKNHLDIVPLESHILGLAEIKRFLDNRNQLVYWWGEWEFCLSRNPVFMSGWNYQQNLMYGRDCIRIRKIFLNMLEIVCVM